MERLAQTRTEMETMSREKKRHKSSETLDYLREAAERECKIRQDELEMKRKQEEGTIATQHTLRDQQQLQMQQQQQQQHQFMQMMQAQSQAIIELLRKGQ